MKYQMTVVLGLIISLAACKPAVKNPIPRAEAVQVKVEQVEIREYKLPVRAAGLLSTTTEMKLGFKTGGIINVLNAREGSSVKRGDVLAVLDLSEIRAQVNQARIAMEKAERDLTRARNLYGDSVATLEQYQNARSAYELAQSQKKIADFNLEHSSIKAPADGRIQKILVERNELIGPAYPAILFASTENDWVVRVALTDKDIVHFSLGDSAHVEMDAFPGQLFPAAIVELGAIADPVTGTYEAELRMLRGHEQFRSGFIARAHVFPTEISRSAVVPMEALLEASDNMAIVYVYKEGEVSRRRVRTGRFVEDRVMVSEGLEPGEWVVTDGAKYITNDSRVNAVNLELRPEQ